VVDRWIPGPYENYLTPEQGIPSEPLGVPWETCMTMGDSWSWNPHDRYKSPRELVHTLIEIVAKGGNLLLGVGPQGNGELPAAALERLKAIGAWMQVNGSAIHASHAIAPYQEGKFRFTQLKDGSVNAIYLADADEHAPPAAIELRSFQPAANARLNVLGVSEPLAWQPRGPGFRVELPPSVRHRLAGTPAWTFRISALRS
jgi:alpha-L-fucosidase